MKALAVALLMASISAADGFLIVNLTGFENDSGRAVLALFTGEEWSFPPDPENAGLTYSFEIENKAVNTEIEGVPSGDYVAFAFHDINGNGSLDPGEEPMGTSQEPGPPGEGGSPSFADMCFSHTGVSTAVRVQVRTMERRGEGAGGFGGGNGGGGRPF